MNDLPAPAPVSLAHPPDATAPAAPSLAQWTQLLDPQRAALIHLRVEHDRCQLLHATDSVAGVLGFPVDELLISPDLCAHLEADERIRLLNGLRKAAVAGTGCVMELHYVHPSTGHRQLVVRAVQASAGASSWHAMVEDITDQGLADQQARHLNATLERRVAERTNALQAKTRELEAFTYSVSHDLKAPLRGIDGYSQLLLEEFAPRLDDQGRDYIQQIRLSARQMTQLIEDLLAYSRLERAEAHCGRVPLTQIVNSVLDERHHALSEGVQISVALQCQWAWGETQAIKLALRNLLDNAIKFSAGQSERCITIGSALHDGRCRLWVQDNGPGFDMRYRERIFGMFQRLHRTEEVPGTGIGLAIVRKAMERTGGRAWAESHPGKGACFYLEMPAASAVSEAC